MCDIGKIGGVILIEFLLEDILADEYATVTDVYAGSGNQLADFGMALSAERTHGEVGGSGHIAGERSSVNSACYVQGSGVLPRIIWFFLRF
jgi:hypothetical protein